DLRFKKSITKLGNDIEKNSFKLLTRVLKILFKEETREAKTIEFLQDYGFIGKHIKDFKEIETSIGKVLTPSKYNELINEQTIHTFFEGIKIVKNLYVNHTNKNL